jgi:hypothetical protein
MRTSLISRAMAVALLMPAVVGIAAAQSVRAAVSHQARPAGTCQTGRDTSGSCSIVNTNVTIIFPVCNPPHVSCRPVIVHTFSTSTYRQGLTVLIPHWGNSRDSIHAGDRVSLRVNKQGLIAFTVLTRRGTVRTHFAPVTMAAPRGGYKSLWVLTKKHGWTRVKGTKVGQGVVYKVTQPGVYKWTRR